MSLVVPGLLLISCFGLSCFRQAHYYSISDTDLRPAVKQLVQSHPDHFDRPYTLIVAVDSSPCPKWLTECQWWRGWQDHAAECGIGFVLATSRADSADLVITARLDSVDAPVLVFPSCEGKLTELKIPRGGVPVKLLIDSTATIVNVWSPMADTVESNRLLDRLSLLCQESLTSADSL